MTVYGDVLIRRLVYLDEERDVRGRRDAVEWNESIVQAGDHRVEAVVLYGTRLERARLCAVQVELREAFCRLGELMEAVCERTRPGGSSVIRSRLTVLRSSQPLDIAWWPQRLW